MKLNIYTDGGARNNPGPSAIGVVVKNQDGKTLDSYGKYIGEQTNNYAEYSALISGLEKAKQMSADEVACYLDSDLVVKQMNRQYKVKEPALQKLFIKAYNTASAFKKISYHHIYREKNKEADKLVNQTLDKRLLSQ
ncbi:MAG: ribonuclease HI family protein [bacterium]